MTAARVACALLLLAALGCAPRYYVPGYPFGLVMRPATKEEYVRYRTWLDSCEVYARIPPVVQHNVDSLWVPR